MIETPNDPAMDELCSELQAMSDQLGGVEDWPTRQLELCAQHGVFRWFLPPEWGGFGWSEEQVVEGYLRLSAACMTTTFILTQRTGACKRIAGSDNPEPKSRLLDDLASGKTFSTVGISHLTTSRRHLDRPALLASETDDGFVLEGMSPWVTGAPFAETIVVGATLDDGREILAVVDCDDPTVSIGPSQSLLSLSASRTGPVFCNQTLVPFDFVLGGPIENVMSQGIGAQTGGLQTSTLALGLTRAAIDFICEQSAARPDLAPKADSLDEQWSQAHSELLKLANGSPKACTPADLRTVANSLVLRSTQAALMAAKGAGYIAGHPTGRWCQEALFFLVWSCPQNVMNANLCELAGIQD